MRGSDLNSEFLFTKVSHSLATDFMPIIINWACICQTMTNNKLRIVIDHTGNQRGKGVKDCLIRLRSAYQFWAIDFWFFLTLSMQISVSIDSDRMWNGQPPQILGAIGHPRYNGISELTDFVITGLHCIHTVNTCKKCGKSRNYL